MFNFAPLAAFWLLLISTSVCIASPDDTCGPLPSLKDTEVEAKLSADANLLAKKIGSGQFQSSYRRIENDAAKQYPNADKFAVKLFVLGMACRSIMSDSTISSDKKIEFFEKNLKPLLLDERTERRNLKSNRLIGSNVIYYFGYILPKIGTPKSSVEKVFRGGTWGVLFYNYKEHPQDIDVYFDHNTNKVVKVEARPYLQENSAADCEEIFSRKFTLTSEENRKREEIIEDRPIKLEIYRYNIGNAELRAYFYDRRRRFFYPQNWNTSLVERLRGQTGNSRCWVTLTLQENKSS